MIRNIIKKSLVLSSLFLLVSASLALATSRLVPGRTVPNSLGNAVADGDTIRVQPNAGGPQLKIRMIGIDTPELHLPAPGGNYAQLPWGQQASDYLESLLPAYTPVILEDHGQDHYGRTLGRIYTADQSTDINYLMVRSGWASPYIYCSGAECQPGYLEQEGVQDYLHACDQARQEGLGIYNPRNPLTEMPFEFRLRIQRRAPEKFVGDFYTHRLYRPADYNQVDVCRRVFFQTTNDAQRLGFQF